MSLQPNRQNKMLASHVYANHRYAQYLHFTCILPTFLFIWDLFLITQYFIHTLTSTETNNLNNKVKTKQRTDDTPSSFNWSFSAVHYDPLDSTWRYCPPVSHKTKQIVYEHLILIISHWDTCLSWVRCSKRGWLWTDGRDVTVQVLIFVDMKPLDTFNETFGHSPIMVPATKFIYICLMTIWGKKTEQKPTKWLTFASLAPTAIVPTRSDFHTDVGSPLIGLVDQRWHKTVPLFCLCKFYTDYEAEKRCSIPTLETQCEGGFIKGVWEQHTQCIFSPC